MKLLAQRPTLAAGCLKIVVAPSRLFVVATEELNMPASSRQVRRAASRRSLRSSRRGNTVTFMLIAVCVVAGLSFAGWWLMGRGSSDDIPEFLTNTVSQGP